MAGETLAEHVDMISALPDAVLLRILSLLPTKDSVRTSALSARWTILYSAVPVLDFHHQLPDPSFATKLEHVSILRISHGTPSETSNILSWIEAAIARSVEEIDLCVVMPTGGSKPLGIFNCGTLVSLSLDANFELCVPDSVCLPSLKELNMKNVRLVDGDESVRRLFSSCPVLEKLTVDSWSMQNSRIFDVSNPSLKCLVVCLPMVIDDYVLLINCPKLEILRYNGYASGGYPGDVLEYLKEFYIENELHSSQFNDVKLMDLVKQACKARFVSLAGDSMEALLSSPSSLPTFENLTHLKLHSLFSEGWRLLPNLLGSSPQLETLVFSKGFYHRDDHLVPFSPPEHVPNCLSFHLKVIKINNFHGEEDEYKYVEYFLMNALVLEKMEISLWSSESLEEENDPSREAKVEGGAETEMQGEAAAEAPASPEAEGEEQGESEDEDEGEGEFDSDLERHFEITKRLLTFQRFSEVCQIDIISPFDEED